ncbi:MAG: glucose/sorbosone dehydrogenase [Bacteroidota bacterium]
MRLLVFNLSVLLVFFSCKPKTDNPTTVDPTKEKIETPKPEPKPTPKPEPKPEFRDIEADDIDRSPINLVANPVTLSNGETFSLNIPEGYGISPAAEGLNRVRFFAKSPDNRIFVTDMKTLADNKKGKVYILEDLDETTKKFKNVVTWKSGLRNPNSLQFYTDKAGKEWLYLALTDSLVRYPYTHGELAPSGKPEKLTEFPGYGLSYKYGGWHLSRTIAVHKDKIYVSVGSSCNLCEEREDGFMRATILVMDPDGSNLEVYADGVRNAVDIGWVEGQMYATNMAADHLGDDKPNDQFYKVEKGIHYGWPYCYETEEGLFAEDPKDQSDNKAAGKLVKTTWTETPIECDKVPRSYALFESHGSPLGFEYFDGSDQGPIFKNYFMAGLHGTYSIKKGRGHQIVRFKNGVKPEIVVDGFIKDNERFGRPCDLIQYGDDGFLFTDDASGIVYLVYKK